MTSRTTEAFRRQLAALPAAVRRQAREAYRRFQADPWQHGLRFKRVHASEPIWSARISGGYRAVCVRSGQQALWFWIGSHADYEALLERL